MLSHVLDVYLDWCTVQSELSADYFPKLELDRCFDYETCLLSFETYNSIPNVDESNNEFHFENGKTIV